MSAQPRYSRLRLVMPSIAQGNAGAGNGGADWCGRTSSAMIRNYFIANRGGGIAAVKSKLIVNQRDRAPYDLVFPGNPVPAVTRYELAGAIQKEKSSYEIHGSKDRNSPPLWPMGARSGVPSRADQLDILAPVLRALEAFNPVLFYSGLSANAGQSRHIVVISGYRIINGELWLHIDDPSSRYTEKDGKPTDWHLTGALSEPSRALDTMILQLPADCGTDEPARRYLLRASRLFEPNLHSKRADDCWCDHDDSPGFAVVLSFEAEQDRALVELESNDAGLPLELQASTRSNLAGLTAARAQARDAGAPFPIGSNRWWHDGIHLFAEGDTAVRPLAGGELLTARLPATASDGRDRGAMVVRHHFDPATNVVVAAGDKVPDGAIAFYTMLAQLAGGPLGAAPISTRLDPGPEPELTLMPNSAVVLVAHDRDGVVHGLADDLSSSREHPRSEGVALTVADGSGAGELLGLLVDDTDEGAWAARAPAPPVAPSGSVHALRDAKTGERFVLDGVPRARIELAVNAADWELVVREQADDRRWCPWQREQPVRIEGATMMCSHEKAVRTAMGTGACAVARGDGTAMIELDAGVLRVHVAWGSNPVVLACNDDGSVALEVFAQSGRSKPTSGGPPVTKLELRVGTRQFWATTPKAVELERVDGALVPGPTKGFYRVRANAVRVVPRSRWCCTHDAADGAALAAMDDDAPVISLKGEAKLRARIGTEGRACALAVDELRAYGDPKRAYEARVRLEPLVGMDDAQWELVADAHAARRSAAHGDVHTRLVARQSRLAAVSVDARGGWKREGDVVRAKDGASPTIILDLVRQKQVWRVVPTSEHTLGSVPSSLRLPLLDSVIAGGRQWAIVEVRLAAREVDFVDTLLQRWQTRKSLHDRVVDELVSGAWVDFAAIEREVATTADPEVALAKWRAIGRDPIAHAGFVEPGERGVHLQLFSAEQLFPDDDVHGHWFECGDEVSGDPLSRELFESAVRAVLAPRIGQRASEAQLPQVTALLRALERGPITPQRWRELCAEPEIDRLLSRVVAVHDGEWTIDWAEAARKAARAPQDRDAVEPIDAAWPSDPAALGLPSGKLRFYHPLRALEWLGTGLDVTVASSSCDAAKLVLPGDLELDLDPRARSDGYAASCRMLLGEVRERPVVAQLHVPKHTRGDEPLPILLARGEVNRLWVCAPDVTVTTSAVDRGLQLAMPTRRRAPEPAPMLVHLLADDNARLDAAWESRASVTLSIGWNLHPPEQLSIALGGDGFVFDGEPRSSSAVATCTKQGSGYRVTFAHEPRPAFTGPSSLQIELSVRAGTQLGCKAELKIEASGGDLQKDVSVEHRFETRKLVSGLHGRDVAKVQLYLSQICVLGQPLLLPSGRNQSAAIGGCYDQQLALALWTFALAFGARGDWASEYDALVCAKGEVALGNPLWSRTAGDSDEQAWALLCNAALRHHREHGAITVDEQMIAELVRHFALPHVVPVVELAIAPARLPAMLAAHASKLRPSDATRLLPAIGVDPANMVRLTVTLAAGFERGRAERAWVEIDDGGGDYQLADSRRRRTLAELLDDGIELVPSGTVGAEKPRNCIALTIDGHAIGSITLAGTRTLHVKNVMGGLDVLLAQHWLTQQRETTGAPLLPAVTGAWGPTSLLALERFLQLRESGPDYEDELRDLASGLPQSQPAMESRAP